MQSERRAIGQFGTKTLRNLSVPEKDSCTELNRMFATSRMVACD